jgi:ferrous iron transport protein B
VLRVVLRNSWMFVRKAGTVILGFSILLWAALYYPRIDENAHQHWLEQKGFSPEVYEKALDVQAKISALGENPNEEQQVQILAQAGLDASTLEKANTLKNEWSGAQVEQSWAGMGGKLIEPLIEPMGFDWKIGIGLIGAFAAREVFVSTMGVVYSVGEDSDEESQSLHEAMVSDRRADGSQLWTLPTVLSVLVFFVIAMQCISTIAVMRQETGGWKWPLIQLFTMNGLAYVLSTFVFQIGTLLMSAKG